MEQALTEEQLVKAEGHTKFCVEQVGVEYETAKKLRFGVIADSDEKNQCFTRCFMQRSGFMDEAGVFQKDVMIEKLGLGKDEETQTKLAALVTKCLALEGANTCETAFKVHNCYWEQASL